MSNTLIMDNGGGTIKVGWAHESEPRHVVPNATAKVKKSMEYLVGKKIDDYLNGSQLIFSRPFDRGYLCNWKCEVDVWTSIFHEQINCVPSQTSLLLTEPLINLPTIQNETNEVVFEYFGFQEYSRKPSMWYSAYGSTNDPNVNQTGSPVCLVLDSGFSYSHTAIFVDGKCVRPSIRRVNIGGKLLTNYLKELVSYRQWNMMDEFILMNQVKEELCYVSNDVVEDLKQAKYCNKAGKAAVMFDLYNGPLKRNFVLPDFHQILRGFVKPEFEPISNNEQLLAMETERFSVPELLFFPTDIGLVQPGLPEAAAQSLATVEEVLAEAAANLVVLTGGNTKFRNFNNRFTNEMRKLIPNEHDLKIYHPDSPDHFVWQSANKFLHDVKTRHLESPFISRATYLEYGSDYCNRFFDNQW